MLEIKKFNETDKEFKELARIDNLVNHDSIDHPEDDKNNWEIRDRAQIRNRLLLYKDNILIGAIYYSQGKDENRRTAFYTLHTSLIIFRTALIKSPRKISFSFARF